MKLSTLRGKGKKKSILKPLGKDLLKHSKDTTLNLEHKNLLISILVDLPNIKKLIEDNVVGCAE